MPERERERLRSLSPPLSLERERERLGERERVRERCRRTARQLCRCGGGWRGGGSGMEKPSPRWNCVPLGSTGAMMPWVQCRGQGRRGGGC